MNEIWLGVVGLEGRYEVSDFGRIRSLPRLVKNRYGLVNYKGYKYLKPYPSGIKNSRGSYHLHLRLYDENLKVLHKTIHRLVLEAFVGPCPDGMQCCHNDGDPTNNHVENLRWDTAKENMKDRERHGRHDKGSSSVKAKLTESDIPVIRRLLMRPDRSMNAIAVRYKVNVATIRDIRDGKTWKHVL